MTTISNNNPKIVLPLGPVEPSLVTPFLGENVSFVTDPTPQDIKQAEGIIVRAANVVDKAVMDSMPSLRVIARTGVGTEKVDLEEATKRNIPVVITPGSNARAVAEGTFALLMALIKKTVESHNYVAENVWGSKPPPVPDDLYGKTIAIVGFGRIGQQVSNYAQAFGMKVIVYDPFVEGINVPQLPLEEAITLCDAITFHLPGGKGELVTKELLATAKPGLILINTARAEIISTTTIQDGLETGLLAGVGLDVFDVEPRTNHPLSGHNNVLFSPHTTGLSYQATHATFKTAALGIASVLSGNTPTNIANTQLITP